MLNEGLEVLGAEEVPQEETDKGHAFTGTALDRITIPSTLKVIEPSVFEKCKGVKRMEFLEGRKILGKDSDAWNRLFRDSRVEEVVLPGTLKDMSPNLFRGSSSLKIVWVGNGCRINVSRLVNPQVRVWRK